MNSQSPIEQNTSQGSILLQCTRLSQTHSLSVDLIVDETLRTLIASFEHTSSDMTSQERRLLEPESLKGELLDIEAIRIDHKNSNELSLEKIQEKLSSYPMELAHDSFDFIKSLAWPTKGTQLRCAIADNGRTLNFFSPGGFVPKLATPCKKF